MSNVWKFVILIVASYLLGNITFARLFARTRNNDDITTHGSGNPGTMNMLRTHGLWLAVVTLIFDALKAVICCLAGYFWVKATGSDYLANVAMYVAGVSCVVGHIYPVIYRFKGGKGVATGFGLACVVQPILIPVIVVVFGVVFAIWRVASLSSLSGVIAFVIGESVFLLAKGYYTSFILLVCIASLIVFAHRKNIEKLLANKEGRIDLNEAVQKDRDYALEQRQKRKKKIKETEPVVESGEVKEIVENEVSSEIESKESEKNPGSESDIVEIPEKETDN